MSGQFIISLDFELLWGVRDHADRQTYGHADVVSERHSLVDAELDANPLLIALEHGDAQYYSRCESIDDTE